MRPLRHTFVVEGQELEKQWQQCICFKGDYTLPPRRGILVQANDKQDFAVSTSKSVGAPEIGLLVAALLTEEQRK